MVHEPWLYKKNYAENLKINVKYESSNERKSFTSGEIKLIWQNVNQNEYISIILILIYSGVRIMELLDLEKEDVDIEQQYFNVRASKTDSGVRVVPIADKVLPFWKYFSINRIVNMCSPMKMAANSAMTILKTILAAVYGTAESQAYHTWNTTHMH